MPLKRLTRPEPLPTAPLRIAFLRDHPCPIHPWQNESPRMNAAIPERRPATEEISGVMERVTFHNDDSGFCVLRVNKRASRGDDGRGVAAFRDCWGMASRGGMLGQGPGTRGCNSKPALSCVRDAISRSPTLRDVPQQYKNF